MKHSNNNFEGTTIYLDGNHYDNCGFHRCQLIYSGGALPIFSGALRIEHCEFAFADAADRTMGFLHLMYHLGNKVVIEEVFNKVRGGQSK
jgi:hypothetical protein